jgi:hypothetical protein
MKGINLVQSNHQPWARVIATVILGFCLASCVDHSPPVSKAEYSTQIVGRWQGRVGDSKETMSIDGDGTFVCQLYPMGFLANTLSEGVPGMVRGTWKITGSMITLSITREKNEPLRNKISSSTIVSFTEGEIVLRSDRGETSPFRRAGAL